MFRVAAGSNFAGVNDKIPQEIMEENKEDIIYDLESAGDHAESAEGQGAQSNSVKPDSSDISEKSDGSELSDNSDRSDSSGLSESELELRRMVEEMGAETILEIIRDNRNAAIRQIISEVEASREKTFPSGGAVHLSCSSIFDLAAQA